MNNYGIVIIGYKNIKGIMRLLNSLDHVDFKGERNITLIISIDYSGDDSVEQLAKSYNWNYGKKMVIAHKSNLGLRKHILSCGNYIEEFDLDAVAVLEDDIYVSPEMYNYMKCAVEFYKDEPQIAGISLYKHEFNINAKHPFDEYCDGGDTYFVKYAMSWGQIWLRDQWRDFVRWYEEEKWKNIDSKSIPKNLLKWKNSWLKYHIMYCIDQNKYFVYPRIALSTNFSDIGEHNKVTSTSMQVKLCMKKTSDWKFVRFDETRAIYDAFFESECVADKIGFDKVEVDLYGVKEYQNDTKYVLTRRCLPYKIIKSWGLFLRPIESNVYLDIPGEDIFLYDLSVRDKAPSVATNRECYFEYELKGLNILHFINVAYCVKRVSSVIKQRITNIIKQKRSKRK